MLIYFFFLAQTVFGSVEIIKTLYSEKATPSLFHDDVVGVFDPIANVEAPQQSYDCFHGLGHPYKVHFSFLYQEGNDIAVAVTYMLGTNKKMKHIGSFTVRDGKIESFEIIVINFGDVMEKAFKDVFLPTVFCHAAARAGCQEYFDCHEWVNSIDQGSWYDLRENSLTCRTYYAFLAKEQPEIYCPFTNILSERCK